MLNERGVKFTYRDTTLAPLSRVELKEVLVKLDMQASDILRPRDAKRSGLCGDESQEELLVLMAENPKLVQRPIAIVGKRAVLGRPPENLLALCPSN